MKRLILLIALLTTLNANASLETVEVCFYGLYDQDTNILVIESDSKEYLESIEHEWQSDNYDTLIEISSCESQEVR